MRALKSNDDIKSAHKGSTIIIMDKISLRGRGN